MRKIVGKFVPRRSTGRVADAAPSCRLPVKGQNSPADALMTAQCSAGLPSAASSRSRNGQIDREVHWIHSQGGAATPQRQEGGDGGDVVRMTWDFCSTRDKRYIVDGSPATRANTFSRIVLLQVVLTANTRSLYQQKPSIVASQEEANPTTQQTGTYSRRQRQATTPSLWGQRHFRRCQIPMRSRTSPSLAQHETSASVPVLSGRSLHANLCLGASRNPKLQQ